MSGAAAVNVSASTVESTEQAVLTNTTYGNESTQGTTNPSGNGDDDIDSQDSDVDEDGLTNKEEHDNGTDQQDPDTDNDGLKDGEEVKEYLTDPNNPDTDFGGETDGHEVYLHRNPHDPEDDNPNETGSKMTNTSSNQTTTLAYTGNQPLVIAITLSMLLMATKLFKKARIRR